MTAAAFDAAAAHGWVAALSLRPINSAKVTRWNFLIKSNNFLLDTAFSSLLPPFSFAIGKQTKNGKKKKKTLSIYFLSFFSRGLELLPLLVMVLPFASLCCSCDGGTFYLGADVVVLSEWESLEVCVREGEWERERERERESGLKWKEGEEGEGGGIEENKKDIAGE